jgi:hypothetical protein
MTEEPALAPVPLSRVAACGDALRFEGDALTIDTPRPIEGLVPSPHRRPVLVVDGVRYTLLGATPHGRGVRYTLERERESLYDLPGLPTIYDEDRHITRRKEDAARAVGWVAYAVLAPVMPLLGLLPQGLKRKLVAIGIDPTLSTGTSLGVEWFLCWPTVGIFLLTIIAEARWFTVLTAAAVPLTLIADLGYRWSGLQEDPPQQRGMLSVVPAGIRGTIALVKDARRPPPT